MRRIIFFFLIFFTCNLQIAQSRTLWTPEKYDQYRYTIFARLAVVNHQIDMNNIDYFMLHAAIFYETNRVRAQFGLPLLRHSYNLELAAKSHSVDMVNFKFFDHQSPIMEKRTVIDRLEQVGLANGYMAENIAYITGIRRDPEQNIYTPQQNNGYFSHEYRGRPIPNHTYLSLAREVVRQWMESEGHRKNILNPVYRYLGCGAELYKDPSFYGMARFKITQYFSSRPGDIHYLQHLKHAHITQHYKSPEKY